MDWQGGPADLEQAWLVLGSLTHKSRGPAVTAHTNAMVVSRKSAPAVVGAVR